MFVYSCRLKKSLTFLFSVLVLSAYVFLFSGYILSFREDLPSVQAVASQNEVLIVVDAGHGGEDSGTVSADGTYEKDLNLVMALKIGEKLKEQGFSVLYTREEDKLLYDPDHDVKGLHKISDLKNRTKTANENEGAIFVSVHMNSFSSAKCEGLQVYYGLKDDKSQVLAKSIQSAVVKNVQNENKRQVKPGNDIYVLENVNGEAVLIECGFLSNEEECKKLKNEEYQNDLSFAIVCGIVEYIKEK